jgi:uncharacterized membrane protein YphA (DoxX/SURF4 family)
MAGGCRSGHLWFVAVSERGKNATLEPGQRRIPMTTATLNVHGADETNEQRDATIGAATRNTAQRKVTMGTWIGRVMSGLVIAFMLMASAFPKLFMPALAVQSMQQLGWNPKHLMVIAVLELVGTILYAIPRTAVLGAVLLTGLLGGAIATHLRIENPLFSHTLFPVYVGLLMWGGLWLRNAQVRALLPLLGGNNRARNNA